MLYVSRSEGLFCGPVGWLVMSGSQEVLPFGDAPQDSPEFDPLERQGSPELAPEARRISTDFVPEEIVLGASLCLFYSYLKESVLRGADC